MTQDDAQRLAEVRERSTEAWDYGGVDKQLTRARLDRSLLLRLLDEARAELAAVKDDATNWQSIASDLAAARQPLPRWQHKKRRSAYEEVGRGELQNSTKHIFLEGDRLVAYRGDEDGRLWFRYEPEFDDGRFAKLARRPDAPEPQE